MAEGLAEEAVDTVADVVEDVSEDLDVVAEAVREISKRELKLALGGLGLGLLGGAIIGGFIINKRVQKKHEKDAEEKISQMRDHFQAKERAREGEARKEELELVEELEERVEKLDYTSRVDPRVKLEEAQNQNVFESPEPDEEELGEQIVPGAKDPDQDWNYPEEFANRSEVVPYVIHQDERKEKGYDTTTMTWFEGDSVLVDSESHIIEDSHEVVGDGIFKFGHGCADPNIVYVRNDTLAIEIELVKSDGSFAEDVHGINHIDESTFERMKRTKPRDEQ